MVVWDDCAGKMHALVKRVLAKQLCSALHPPQHVDVQQSCCFTELKIGGWIGTTEYPHNVCVFASFSLSGVFDPTNAATIYEEETPAGVAAQKIFAQATQALSCSSNPDTFAP